MRAERERERLLVTLREVDTRASTLRIGLYNDPNKRAVAFISETNGHCALSTFEWECVRRLHFSINYFHREFDMIRPLFIYVILAIFVHLSVQIFSRGAMQHTVRRTYRTREKNSRAANGNSAAGLPKYRLEISLHGRNSKICRSFRSRYPFLTVPLPSPPPPPSPILGNRNSNNKYCV